MQSIPIKIPASYFRDIDKLILKFICESVKIKVTQSCLTLCPMDYRVHGNL